MDKGEMYTQSNVGEDSVGHCPVNRRAPFT